jgi:cell division septation protein DedD
VEEHAQCPNCGEYNRAVARFCHECGTSLEAAYQDPVSYPDTLSPAKPVRWDEPRRRPSRRWVAVPLGLVALAGILALAGWQVKWPASVFGARQAASSLPVSHRPSVHASPPRPSPSAPPPSATSSAPTQATATATSAPSPAPPVNSAVAIVEAYVAAINRKDYATAWQLDSNNAGGTFAVFVAGFRGTVKDSLKVLKVSGNVVTARLTALHSDGTVQVFQGTYTVQNGIIAASSVKQIG